MCNNGRDDNCDGRIDCADPTCTRDPVCCVPAVGGEVCNNGVDDDCNGLVDCADPSCAMDPSCAPMCPDQNLGSRVGTRVASGTTGGAGNDFTPSCRPGSTAPDVTFTWRAPSSGTWVFDTFGSSYDSVLYVKTSCTGGELPGACNDDSSGGLQSQVSVLLRAGTSVLVVVDGYATSSGPYVLNIHRALTSEAGHCTNGVDDDSDGRIDCADPDCFTDPACIMFPDAGRPDAGFDAGPAPDAGFDGGPAPDAGVCAANGIGVAMCTDEVDNDCDSRVDCADPDCTPFPTFGECCNGIDDNGNGVVDELACRCFTNADCTGIGSLEQVCWTQLAHVCAPRCDFYGGDLLCHRIKREPPLRDERPPAGPVRLLRPPSCRSGGRALRGAERGTRGAGGRQPVCARDQRTRRTMAAAPTPACAAGSVRRLAMTAGGVCGSSSRTVATLLTARVEKAEAEPARIRSPAMSSREARTGAVWSKPLETSSRGVNRSGLLRRWR